MDSFLIYRRALTALSALLLMGLLVLGGCAAVAPNSPEPSAVPGHGAPATPTTWADNPYLEAYVR